ncbi:DNA polymerase epsilon catalytic subunit [Paramarasmius palmivorus]|uniref:DNA polymerase epsilon catalytic subunit n=1 Tax=Paramarasmius palmivorus TaxID=297713 RepID=A0AAW0BKV1_9AGAR
MFSNVKVHTNRYWDGVQLRPSSKPGRYMLWLSVDGELVPVPLRIPRELYIHMHTPNEVVFRTSSYSFEKVTRNLPRDFPCVNLYKITVREDTYQDIREHFIDLTSDPNVDGVFELQVPLLIRALMKIGRTCESRDVEMSLNRAQTVGFDLNQLDTPLPSSSRPKYLNGGRSGNYIFLCHACSAHAPLHVFASFYRSVNYPETREFNTTYHSTDTTALKAISRELGLHENKSYTVVISSSKDDEYFDHHLPKLADFPVLSMSKAKSAHTLDVFPWQSHVVQKMLNRCLSLGSWLDQLVVLADYYDIPIGHIEGDQPLFTADLTFARKLAQQDMILWWSPSDKPDLWGIENDKRPTDELPATEFSVPRVYSNVCLELTLRNLAVNSVIHSVVVNELEGSGGTTAFDSVSKTLDEYAEGTGSRDLTLGESNVSSHTFSILKNMVRTWQLDRISSNETSPATLSIDHFWRWISSSAFNMYDSSIHRFVQGFMRKTFVQLLAEFKRLGSHVVYADFSRTLLATSKPPGTAHAYATHINTAVTSHESSMQWYNISL